MDQEKVIFEDNRGNSPSERSGEKRRPYIVPELPTVLQLGIQDGYCNLRCPGCLFHSPQAKVQLEGNIGHMPMDELEKILVEVKDARPNIKPFRFSEPLMTQNFKDYMRLMKKYNLPITINTNGLLLTKDMAEFFMDIKLDSISFSIDAYHQETYQKMRGIPNLEKANEAVFTMLKARGSSSYPRIGVSFLVSEKTIPEKDDFVSYWIQYVDVIRANMFFEFNRTVKGFPPPQKGIPCREIYNTMMIDFKGDVCICCIDSKNEVHLGNVFRDGVKKVWHGERFNQIREWLVTGQEEKIPFCQSCNYRIDSPFEEYIEDGVLIRKSPVVTFYNRMDRNNTWNTGSYYGQREEAMKKGASI